MMVYEALKGLDGHNYNIYELGEWFNAVYSVVLVLLLLMLRIRALVTLYIQSIKEYASSYSKIKVDD